jgi:hypothetical protein
VNHDHLMMGAPYSRRNNQTVTQIALGATIKPGDGCSSHQNWVPPGHAELKLSRNHRFGFPVDATPPGPRRDVQVDHHRSQHQPNT